MFGHHISHLCSNGPGSVLDELLRSTKAHLSQRVDCFYTSGDDEFRILMHSSNRVAVLRDLLPVALSLGFQRIIL